MRQEIRIAGVGGQGLVSASVILAEALGVIRDFEVVQTQFYSAHITGGSSCGDVVMSDEKIIFPWVQEPDILIALAQDAVNEHAVGLRPGCKVMVDDILVNDVSEIPEGVTVIPVSFTRIADDIGSRRCSNMVALGAFAKMTGLLDLEQISSAVAARAPGVKDLNKAAVENGYDLDLAV